MFKPNPDYDAETYFSSINSMAKRIVMDTVALQTTHAEKWKDLQHSDKDDLITKNFLKPAKTENNLNVSSSPEQNCFPKLLITSGQKIVIEEENANRLRAGKSWRDEHSAPFMWESKSQLNLSYILQEVSTVSPSEEEIKPEEVIAVETEQEANEICEAQSQKVKRQSFKPNDEVVKRSHSKKKIAPPIPTPVAVQKEVESAPVRNEAKVAKVHLPTSDDDDSNDNIPKTGFDFLDNW
uniref:DUF4706 domain-containing protein n=1 Tax=Strigamia maritima TaxID=126957 RepID=T1J967_STRMM